MVLGGTIYTLPLESYLYAPITLFGANVVPLKLLGTLSWVPTSVTLSSPACASRTAGPA